MRQLPYLFLIWSLNSFAEVPPLLSETGLYEDFPSKKVNPKHFYFEPQYPLWTEGAEKSRWISLPAGQKIDNSNQDQWSFPIGTKIWKEFRFSKRVETRLIEKLNDGTWAFATYLWNEDDSQATLAPTAGVKNYFPLEGGKFHDIPSAQQCLRCHSRGGDRVLGFDALQLSHDRDSLALHSGKLSENAVTVKTLVEKNLLTKPGSLLENAPRIYSTSDLGRAAMGYLHGNCGHCHNPNGSAAFTKMYLRHLNSAFEEAQEPAFSTTVEVLTRNFKIPGAEKTYRILPNYKELSAIHYRMENGTMPPIGSSVIDTKAVDLLGEWISHLR